MSGGQSSGSSQSQGFGSSYSNSASLSLPENMTSPYWQNLVPNTQGALLNLEGSLGLNANPGVGLDAIGSLSPGLARLLTSATGGMDTNGAFAAPTTGAQNTTLGQLGSAAGGDYGYNPSAAAEQQVLLSEMENPTGFGQTLAAGLPIAPGMASFASNPNAAGTTAAQALQALLPSIQNPNNAGSGAAGALYSTLAQTDPGLIGMLQPGYAASLATGAPTQSVIDAALQPIKAQFASQTVPGLQGSFAQAGQRGTGLGSSAFDMAFSNAQASELATEAATSGNIVNTVYNTGLNLAGNAATNVAGLEGGAFNTGYTGALNYQDLFSNLTSGAFGQGYAGSVNAQELLQSEEAGLYGTGVNAGLNAPGQLNQLNSSQISDLLSTLQGEALPQLTEQLGINNALSTYQSSINSMLQALGLQVQAEQPVVGYESETLQNSGSFQNEESSGQNSSFSFGLPTF